MPWDSADARGHTKKASSPKAQRQWSAIANSMLKRGESEGAAVRAANGVVKKRAGKAGKKRGGGK